ncbi:MAG: hypothetical protein RI884_1149 [Pseudomonadota bacterium]|jgi:hypothetical protein
MKRFDPSVGWIQGNSTATSPPEPQAGEPLPHPSSVYHFNRQGSRLNVTRVEDGQAASTAGEAPVPPAVQRLREAKAPEPFLRAPAETAGMVRELFERLDDADPSQALLARVSDNLQTLDDLAVKKGQLERVLADIAQEMLQLQAQVRSDLDAARDSEDRNLKLRQYRRELLEQLARRLPEADPT